MTDREKLIALLGRMSCDVIGIDSCDTCEHRYEIDCTAHAYAYYLLANGVVVREKGEWELAEFQSCPLDTDQALVCSCCGFAHQYDAWFNFCPNCGADMRRRENG